MRTTITIIIIAICFSLSSQAQSIIELSEDISFVSSLSDISIDSIVEVSTIAEDGTTECIRYGELYTVYSEVISKIVSKTNIDENELVLSEENDVILPASGETQIDIATASCVEKSGIALGGDLNIIKSQIDGIFLSYYLNNARKRNIARLAQGISVVHLYASQLAILKIDLPYLREQTKIADFLSSIDKSIENIVDKIEQSQKWKQGLLQKMFV